MKDLFEIVNGDNKITYKVFNQKKSAHVYAYLNGILWCKYVVRGLFDKNFPDVQQFLTSKIFSNDIYLVRNYLKNLDKYFKDKSI